jgi:hypothetical protein
MARRTGDPSLNRSAGNRRARRDGVEAVTAIEIETGRAVPNHWDERHLVERWEDRKARRAAEKNGSQHA